jgi:hypothetical protein
MHIGSVLDIPPEFDATKRFSPAALRRANVPEGQWRGFHISTVLALRREDMKFLGDW